ncbi:hypothetical protein HWB76_gp018 [Streptomyces phage Blueeyedbeauty]|uniref:Uncharacterized protein n=1 Tax=Streptomyces phage Blueeyedbeauty TaxID=2250336 RepID=A0A345L280_9CAUD|nr:hypothetical protein HWB76_gp018 [Streptomyces phage Blueeyedbeauty]AXH49382.1 hypothetical protein SEA_BLUEEYEDBEAUTY_275 [Streptomyces phage Blueeyedbeauty]
MSQTRTHGHGGYFGCRDASCPNVPAVHGSRTRCRCEGWQTQNKGKCTACDSPVLADWEWDLLTGGQENGGFVESEGIKEYPITIIAYRGKNKVTVSGIREDSVSAKVDREGNCNLSFEFRDYPDRIGYIPCIDWYETECE